MSDLERLGITIARSCAVRGGNERQLQDAIEGVLRAQSGLAFVREFQLDTRSRLDFVVGTLDSFVAIEVKILGALNSLVRQLHRYALDPRICGLLVVTTRIRLTAVPQTLAGKPVVTCLLRAAF